MRGKVGPPFLHWSSIPVYIDADLAKKNLAYFNPGVHTKSFRIKA